MNVITHAEENERTDEEIEDILNDIYGNVDVCGFSYESGRLLKLVDRIAFDMVDSDDPLPDTITYECGECGEIYSDDNEDEAEACCQEDDTEEEA